LKIAPIVAVEPTGEEAPETAVVGAAPAVEPVQVAVAEPPAALPHTASSMPLLALIGLLLLGAGLSLALFDKRTA